MRKKDMFKVIFRKVYVFIRKLYVSQKIKNKHISIISNNCIGADICDCGRKLLLTVNWSVQLPNTKTASIDNLPAGVHFMEYYDTYRKYYERNFNIAKWVIGLTGEGG